jgi:hypothetical protein
MPIVTSGTSTVSGGSAAWPSSASVSADELRRISMMGVEVLIRRNTSGTTAATYTALEAANWTYMSQSIAPAFIASSVVNANFLISVDGKTYRRNTTGTSGASFTADAVNWTVTNDPDEASALAFSQPVVIGELRSLSIGGVTCVIQSTSSHIVAASFTTVEAALWNVVGQSSTPAFTASIVVPAGYRISQDGRIYERTAVGTTGLTFDAAEQALWSLKTGVSTAQAWAASTPVQAGEIRYFVIGGARVYASSITARTTGATADAAEFVQWFYISQSIVPGFFPPSTAILQGFVFTLGDTLWQSPSNRTSGATFSDAEQAQWVAIAPGITDWATGISYGVGRYVNQNKQLYKCIIAHTSGTFDTDLTALNWERTGGTDSVQFIAADTTLTEWDQLVVVTSSCQITLPTAVGNTGKKITISRVGGTNGDVSFLGFGAETISGISPGVYPHLSTSQSIVFESDGVNVHAVAENKTLGSQVFVGSAQPEPYFSRQATLLVTNATPASVVNPVFGVRGDAYVYTILLRSSFAGTGTWTFGNAYRRKDGNDLGTLTVPAFGYRTLVFCHDGVSNLKMMSDSSEGSGEVLPWSGDSFVGEGEIRRKSMQNTDVFISSLSARTTDTLWSVTEASFWEVVGQEKTGTFLASDDVMYGVQISVNGELLERISTGTTGASISTQAELDAWQRIAVSKYRGVYSSTDAYAANEIVLYQNNLYRSNFARTSGVFGAAPLEGVIADTWTKLPGVVKGGFSVANSYSAGDLVWDSGTNIGLVPGIYLVDVSYTAGNAPDHDNFTAIAVSPVYRGAYGLGEFKVGQVVSDRNRLYEVMTDNGSNNLGGPFDETKFSPMVFTKVAPWVAAEKVGPYEVRRMTLLGVQVLMYNNSATERTTSATLDALELVDWKYFAQESIPGYVASTLRCQGMIISENGHLWQSPTNVTGGATFDTTEQLLWTRLTTDTAAVKTVTADYTATNYDDIIMVDSTAGSVVITLPVTLSSGKKITVHKLVAANTVTIQSSVASRLVNTSGSLVTSEIFSARFTNIPYFLTTSTTGYWAIFA